MERIATRVEEACLNGWPSLSTVFLEDWILRFAGGHTKRANSVNALAPAAAGRDGFAGRLAACRALYAARGLPTILRHSSAAPQEGLEAALDRAGFDPPEDETRVLLAETLAPVPEAGARLRIDIVAPEPDWLAAFARISALDETAARLHGRILDALAVPAAFAAVEAEDGTTGAVAFGALHDRLICVNSVATAAAHRGRGLGRRAVSAVMAWARSAGAEAACLPVGAANAPALALYRSLGFTREVSRYHYRIARQP